MPSRLGPLVIVLVSMFVYHGVLATELPLFRFALLVPDDSAESADVADTVASFLGDLPVHLERNESDAMASGLEATLRRAQEEATARHLQAVAWLDVGTLQTLWIWVRDSDGERLLVRPLDAARSASTREGQLEELGVALRSAVRVLIAGTQASPPRAARSLPPARLEIAYGAAWVDSIGDRQDGLRWGVLVGDAWQLGVHLRHDAPVRLARGDIGLHVSANGADIAGGRRWSLAGLDVETFAGAQVERRRWSLQSAADDVSLRGDHAMWLFGGQMGVRGIVPYGAAGFVVGLGLDAWANETRYGVDEGGQPTVIATPWVVQPWISLGLRGALL